MTYAQIMDDVTRAFEVVGVAVLVVGFSVGAARVLLGAARDAPGGSYLAGLIVVIRTFLSFSLEIEIDGVVPWRRGGRGALDRSAQAGGLAPE